MQILENSEVSKEDERNTWINVCKKTYCTILDYSKHHLLFLCYARNKTQIPESKKYDVEDDQEN